MFFCKWTLIYDVFPWIPSSPSPVSFPLLPATSPLSFPHFQAVDLLVPPQDLTRAVYVTLSWGLTLRSRWTWLVFLPLPSGLSQPQYLDVRCFARSLREGKCKSIHLLRFLWRWGGLFHIPWQHFPRKLPKAVKCEFENGTWSNSCRSEVQRLDKRKWSSLCHLLPWSPGVVNCKGERLISAHGFRMFAASWWPEQGREWEFACCQRARQRDCPCSASLLLSLLGFHPVSVHGMVPPTLEMGVFPSVSSLWCVPYQSVSCIILNLDKITMRILTITHGLTRSL